MKGFVLIILICGTFSFFGQNEVCFEIQKNPHTSVAGFDVFDKYTNVFGVHIFGTAEVEDLSFLHCAAIMAEYLDNDEDGLIINTVVLDQMILNNASMVIFPYEEHDSKTYFFDQYDGSWEIQELYANEIHPEGSNSVDGFDVTIRANLNLITQVGYHNAFNDELGEEIGSDLALAMNEARGGYFPFVPDQYPDLAWYHNEDVNCDYFCQIREYIYWGLTSFLGAQDYPGRCEEILSQWELCTPDGFIDTDISLYEILSNPEFNFPISLPDGIYCPISNIESDLLAKAPLPYYLDHANMEIHFMKEMIGPWRIVTPDGRTVQKGHFQGTKTIRLNHQSRGILLVLTSSGTLKIIL